MLHAIFDYYKVQCDFPVPTGKVALFSLVAKELSRFSPKSNPWSWQYIQGVVTGRMEPSRYLQEAIEKLYNEINGRPPMIPVPACPVPGCTDPHQHKHGEQVYDPATLEVRPIKRKRPSKLEPPRLTAKCTEGLHYEVQRYAKIWNVPMSEIVRRAVEAYLLPEIFAAVELEKQPTKNGTNQETSQ